ncbi:hypothetical protein KZ417_11085, partial [Glaesserella parasuis]|nr:hypothetical protein [Glaesserella parasuis]
KLSYFPNFPKDFIYIHKIFLNSITSQKSQGKQKAKRISSFSFRIIHILKNTHLITKKCEKWFTNLFV